ncbi:MAG: peptidoglycan-associated lipoprotein Pal [Lautropia sp.]|nr:peptidoglycan-associated lipoprotein Pal [Lautropia sp.]
MFSTLSKRRLFSLGLSLAILSGCTSVDLGESDEHAVSAAPEEDTQGQDGQADLQKNPVNNAQDANPIQSEQSTNPLDDPNSPLARREVFFEFDSFAILPDYQATIEAHANYLSSHRDKHVVLEGNTDEFGSREYNLALGQKRADAVRRALATLGVDDNQMESISFGEEKPRASGTDDASRSQNRRVDINYR